MRGSMADSAEKRVGVSASGSGPLLFLPSVFSRVSTMSSVHHSG